MADYDDSAMEASDFEDPDSDPFSPEPIAKKAKPAPKKGAAPKAPKATKPAPAKKLTQTTLKSLTKKRPKPASDDEDEAPASDIDMHDASTFSNTPPSSKKQRKDPPPKKAASKPLMEVENESINLDGPSDPKPAKKKTATDQYQKLTQLEHIIKRPDTYIGSTEATTEQMWVFNSETSQMELRKVTFVPGLYKIFDEILVNAADNKQRDPSMNAIKVVVNREKGEISVENNGRGIPVEMHAKEKIYIPEMIFGHLLTGSNYDDDEQKTTGGRNGYGAKLCNVFSTEFTLETQDSNTGKRYKQIWTDNMSKMGKAKISSSKSADFTRVTFSPDYHRFGMTGIDDDFEALVKRRVYDMAGTLKGVKVSLNGNLIKLDFKKYITMYAKAINKERGMEEGTDTVANTVIVDDPKTHDKWEIGFAVSDGSFQQVSFVNSIATTSGGTHVNYIADQICDKLLEVVKKKNAKGMALKGNQIRNHIFLFVNCLIVNPAFNSQTKEQLTTKKSAFGSKCVLTDEFLKKVGKTDAVQNILDFAQKKADQVLAKSDGNRRTRMSNPKLVDANLAGTRHGHECTLILTEGESAKGLAVAGRAILDPNRIGVFALRGKLLNVRDASIDQIAKNAEIQNIKQFLGLKHKTTYTTTVGLRYGHLMIMADQDHDGSHIKGLLINFLQVQYPSLLKLPEFFREFITPIVKVWKGPNPKRPLSTKSFFNLPQYEEWQEQHKNDKGWKHKYYKGLGTSAPEEGQIYFSNLDEHLREFETMKPAEEELIELAFSKKKADARKAWLGDFRPGTYLDHSAKTLSYDDFVNKELILFSVADNLRSIPSVIDGLKPGQRKVMYACFKRNLVKDTKVVELAGYVSENTAYHHGEVSMHQTIIGLAQNFVGSNNVNCLEPSGSFGSRLAGGSDSASPRYIFTRLSPFARRVFSALDEPIHTHNEDDGKKIEPTLYCPVVPMILINGADGIGTGWSTSIPNYHPIHVVNNLKRRMGRLEGQGDEEKPFETMMPWFRGWKGTPQIAGPDRYSFNGIVSQDGDNEVVITELPIRMWTDDFKAKLEEIIKAEKVPSFIKDYKEFNDHKNVHFVIQLDEKHMKAALADGLAERFKLNKTIATSNLVAFDLNGQIKKYEKVEDILEEFYNYRFSMYTKRKAYWLAKLNTEYRKIKNQARFVTEIIDNKLVVSKKRKPVLVAELRKRDYEAFPKVSDAKKAGEDDDVVENEDEATADEDAGARDYDYLLGLPIWSLTQERVDKLKQQMVMKKEEHDSLAYMSEKDLWCKDLDDFVQEWENQLKEDADYDKSIRNTNRRHSRKIGAGKSAGRKAASKNDDDYNPSMAKAKAKTSKADPAKGIVKVEMKSNQRFADMFAAKPKSKSASLDGADDSEGLSDDDFEALTSKPAPKSKSTSRAPSEQPATTNGRSKRTAAAAPKNWIVDGDEDSESSDGLGDIDQMVKGIGGIPAGDKASANGRVSLFAMSRLDSSHGGPPTTNPALPKIKTKASRTFDISDNDETNYEMLARSSPHKTAPALKDDLDSFLSDEEDVPVIAKKAAVPKAAVKAVPKQKKISPVLSDDDGDSEPIVKKRVPAVKAVPKKKVSAVLSDDDEDSEPVVKKKVLTVISAPKAKNESPLVIMSDDTSDEDPIPPKKAAPKAAAKPVAKPAPKAKKAAAPLKPTALSPAAKAYAAKQNKSKPAKEDFSDEDSDLDMDDASPPPKPAARGRPARAAAAAKPKKPVYVDSEDDDDMEVDDLDESALVEDEDSEDDFE